MTDYNTILDRNKTYDDISKQLYEFEQNKHDITQKRGFYVYGDSGVGKTKFIDDLLKKHDYYIVRFDAGDVRNKSIIDTITKQNMNDRNVMDMFNKKKRNIAIVMDEIDGMNSGDKGGINSLIKLIRPKKTKKQKEEISTNIPVFCISNGKIDKKMKELMKVCNIHKLLNPSREQIHTLVKKTWGDIHERNIETIYNYVQSDLRKLHDLRAIHSKCDIFNDSTWSYLFNSKCYYDDAKEHVKIILNQQQPIASHNCNLNETDRTIISLLLHENIIDVINKGNTFTSIPFYIKILRNFCFGDYVDRITFQKQIWQFNEMSSLIKTYYNQYLLHTQYKPKNVYNPQEIRFTKVLTKYSTEYNNATFLQTLCEKMNLDKKDMLLYFYRHQTSSNDDVFLSRLDKNYDVCRLDVHRINKFININFRDETESHVSL